MFVIKKGDIIEVFAAREASHYSASYTFSPYGISVPVEVLEEYPRWYLCLVLPHMNPAGFGRESIPYRITIPKHDITSGFVQIRKLR